MRRLYNDWPNLKNKFFSGGHPGDIESVDFNKGDSHRGGRTVAVIKFKSGVQLIYKPKALAVDAHFQELISWLNEKGIAPWLKPMKILDCGQYGWTEFIFHKECKTIEEIQAFYERQGAYLAILYSLEATDIHYENLIACADHPFIVDLETLFHPRVEKNATSIMLDIALLDESVLRVGLLPHNSFSNSEEKGIDLSGLGAIAGQQTPFDVPQWEGFGTDEMRLAPVPVFINEQNNRPTLKGQNVNLSEYLSNIVTGFTDMYRLIMDNKDGLLHDNGPLRLFGEDETRVVLRPTLTYGTLLRGSYHPDIMRDAIMRDTLLEWLRLDIKQKPWLSKVLMAEQKDLIEYDIPMFVTRPESHDLWTSSGKQIPNFFDCTAMTRVRKHIQELNEADLEKQLWIIKASVLSSKETTTKSTIKALPKLDSLRNQLYPLVDKGRLVDAAAKIGYQLEKRAIRIHEGVSWLGLISTGSKRYSISPLGFSLYDGLPGITLFFSYLASVCKESCFEDSARGALNTIQSHLTELSLKSLSLGVFDGVGGIIYLLTHLGSLWNDTSLLTQATDILDGIQDSIHLDRQFDIISGSAGCLASAVALYRTMPSDQVLETAINLGDHLLKHAQSNQGYSWPSTLSSSAALTGFAHGASGIGWALIELASLSNENRFISAALKAFDYERTTISNLSQNWPDFRVFSSDSKDNNRTHNLHMSAWCHGAPGITLARLKTLRYIDNPEIRSDITIGLTTTIREGFGNNHSLCHGDMGNLEVLLQASKNLKDPRWQRLFEQRLQLILLSSEEYGWSSGIPLDINPPGLMTGLSGIGFMLMRVAFPDKIPSILTLDAPQIST